MLPIVIPEEELWDSSRNEFVMKKGCTLQLEHSLVSISKWESKWHKPFLSNVDKTNEETLDYIRCMTISQNVDPDVFNRLTRQNITDINAYIDNPMTATTFSNNAMSGGGNREIITSELIYYWMVSLRIPVEFQKWHLNRLLTLIRICSIKNQPPKKMSKRDIMSRNAALNASRKQQMNTKG